MLQNAASLRKPALWASDLLKCLIDISLVSRSSSNAHDCHRFWKLLRNPLVWLTDLEMCLAPKRRALFRHLNFQKWSEHVVCLLYHLDFHMCFDVLRCASPHNGVQFFISSPKMEPTFWASARLFYLFAHLYLLSADPFSSDSFSSLTSHWNIGILLITIK